MAMGERWRWTLMSGDRGGNPASSCAGISAVEFMGQLQMSGGRHGTRYFNAINAATRLPAANVKASVFSRTGRKPVLRIARYL